MMMKSMYQSEHNQRPRESLISSSSSSPNNNFHQLRRRSSIESIAGSSSCSISSLTNEIDDWSITHEIYGTIVQDIDDDDDASLTIDATLHKQQTQQQQAHTTKVSDNNFKRMSSDESTSTAPTVSLSCSDRSSDYLSSSDHSLLKGINTTPSTSSEQQQQQLVLSREVGSDRSIKSNDSESSSTLHLLAATPSREDDVVSKNNEESLSKDNKKKNNKVAKKPHTELRKKHRPLHRCPKVNQGVTSIIKKHSKYSPPPSLLFDESIKLSVVYTKSRRTTQETVTSTATDDSVLSTQDLCLLGQSSCSSISSSSSNSSSHTKSGSGRLSSLISDKLKNVMPHRKRISNIEHQQEQQQHQEEEDGIKPINRSEHESSVLCHSTSSSSSSFFNNNEYDDPLYSDDWLPKLVEFSASMEIYVFRV